jgi:hypothetical protein
MYEADSSLETIKKLAKETLTISIGVNNSDSTLWDRAQRLVCNVEYIVRLPEVAKSGMQIDRFCLTSATYFSDAGLARNLESKKHVGTFYGSGSNGDDLLHDCTEIVSEKLTGIIKRDKIEKINSIIVEAGSNFAKKPEAMILSDARNLDDMGAAGLFHEFRRYTFVGKGVFDALQLWKRKVDYRYWQARLKESFRFESVRKLAEKRLSTAEYFMNQLNIETEASDLEELSTDSSKT